MMNYDGPHERSIAMSTKDEERWRFILTGNVAIYPLVDEDGNTICLAVETETDIWECASPSEVNNAIDIAMHRHNHSQPNSLH